MERSELPCRSATLSRARKRGDVYIEVQQISPVEIMETGVGRRIRVVRTHPCAVSLFLLGLIRGSCNGAYWGCQATDRIVQSTVEYYIAVPKDVSGTHVPEPDIVASVPIFSGARTCFTESVTIEALRDRDIVHLRILEAVSHCTNLVIHLGHEIIDLIAKRRTELGVLPLKGS